jgi:hypothetical protein
MLSITETMVQSMKNDRKRKAEVLQPWRQAPADTRVTAPSEILPANATLGRPRQGAATVETESTVQQRSAALRSAVVASIESSGEEVPVALTSTYVGSTAIGQGPSVLHTLGKRSRFR